MTKNDDTTGDDSALFTSRPPLPDEPCGRCAGTGRTTRTYVLVHSIDVRLDRWAAQGMVTAHARLGSHVVDCCREAVGIAAAAGRPVAFRFNDQVVVVRPGDDPDAVALSWRTVSDKLRTATAELDRTMAVMQPTFAAINAGMASETRPRDGEQQMAKRFEKTITYFMQPARVACDGKCGKAWGRNNRPRVKLSDDEDDFEWLADDELGEAPVDPGTYEGSDAKPIGARGPEEMNKWCVRECERCTMTKAGEPDAPLQLKDFSRRVSNRRSVE